MGIEYFGKADVGETGDLMSIIIRAVLKGDDYKIIKKEERRIALAVKKYFDFDNSNEHIIVSVERNEIYVLFNLLINRDYEFRFLNLLEESFGENGIFIKFEEE